MGGAIAAANIKIGAEIQGAINNMKQTGAAVRSLALDVNTTLTAAYKKASSAQNVFKNGLTKLGDKIQKVSGKMALIGGLPAIYASAKFYKDYANLQKLDRGLERFGVSLQQVRELAKLPNIGVFDGAQSVIQLRAAGASAQLATRSIKSFANAITEAGGSATDLSPALVNLQQFLSTGHINQVDLRQLSSRIPQVNEALKNAFGTTDVKQLNKLPMQEFINGLITELEKIPLVAGGAGMAMEQFGDDMLFASASIGEMLEKSFNISGIIGSMGDLIGNVTDNLKALSPEAQKSILALGSMAVILPAITAAIGGAIKVIPILLTGFGAISGTVGLVVAALGLGAAAIITNWDIVKATIQNSGFWTNLVTVVKSTMGIVAELFKTVVNLVQGDWANMGNALVNILKNAANGVVSILGGMLKSVAGALGELNHWIARRIPGMSDLTRNDGITGWINGSVIPSIEKLTNKLQFDVPDAFGIMKNAMASVKEAMDDSIIPPAPDPDGDKLSDFIEKLTAAQFELWKIDLSSKWLKEQAAVKSATEEYKKLVGVVAGLKSDRLLNSGDKEQGFEGLVNKSERDARMMVGLDSATKSMDEFIKTMKKVKTEYGDYVRSVAQTTLELNAVFADGINQVMESVVIGFAEMIGEAIAGVNNIHEVGRAMMGTIGQLISNLGKALVGASKIGIALKAAFASPTTAAIVGVGMIALGTALKASMQKQTANVRFAKGGMAYGEMQAIVGDNPNARFDPELIAPYSKVDRSIAASIRKHGSAGGNILVEVSGIVRGNDLEIIVNRVTRRNNYLKGR